VWQHGPAWVAQGTGICGGVSVTERVGQRKAYDDMDNERGYVAYTGGCD
jgi:hypothetical protein